jgi:hypothetical protein
VTDHTTHTVCVIPTAEADAIHADLVSEVAPQCDRHWSESPGPTHTIDGTDYYRVEWPVRPQVAQALLDLVDAGTYPDLSVTPSTTPYADITYPPLPDEGETCERGQIYDAGDRYVMCRQTHPRGIHPVADVPALFALYREGGDLTWTPDSEWVTAGEIRTVDGVEWRALQDHQTQQNRKPGDWMAGWVRVEKYVPGDDPIQWEVGIEWSAGDRCIYEGVEYECVIPHTSLAANYAPDVYQAGWDPV